MQPFDEDRDPGATGEVPAPAPEPAAWDDSAAAPSRRARYTAHVANTDDPPTRRLRRVPSAGPQRSYEGIAATAALIALALVLLEVTTDVLPDAPVAWVVTPVRLVLLIGLGAVALSGMPARRWLTPLDIPIAVLVLAALVASVVARGGLAPIRGLLTAVAVYYLAVGVRRCDPESWHGITLLSFVGVATASLVALDQFIGRTPTGFCRASIDGTRDGCSQAGAMVRSIGTFANPNLLAAFLVLTVPLAIAWVLTQRGTTRTIGWLVVVAGYLATLSTISRGGALAIAVGTGCYLLLRRPTPARVRWASIGLGVAAVALTALTVLGIGVGLRMDVWRAALRVSLNNPLGVGLGRAGSRISAVDPGDRVYQHAHNLWLNWLVEGGWLALLAAIALTVLAGWLCLHAARRWSVPGVAVGAALGGFAVLCLMDHPANSARIAMLMWAVLGPAATAADPVERLLPPPGSRAARRGD